MHKRITITDGDNPRISVRDVRDDSVTFEVTARTLEGFQLAAAGKSSRGKLNKDDRESVAGLSDRARAKLASVLEE